MTFIPFIRDIEAFKTWVVHHLKPVCNHADPDAVSLYVSALMKKPTSKASLREHFVLFLDDGSDDFIDLLLEVLETEEYLNFKPGMPLQYKRDKKTSVLSKVEGLDSDEEGTAKIKEEPNQLKQDNSKEDKVRPTNSGDKKSEVDVNLSKPESGTSRSTKRTMKRSRSPRSPAKKSSRSAHSPRDRPHADSRRHRKRRYSRPSRSPSTSPPGNYDSRHRRSPYHSRSRYSRSRSSSRSRMSPTYSRSSRTQTIEYNRPKPDVVFASRESHAESNKNIIGGSASRFPAGCEMVRRVARSPPVPNPNFWFNAPPPGPDQTANFGFPVQPVPPHFVQPPPGFGSLVQPGPNYQLQHVGQMAFPGLGAPPQRHMGPPLQHQFAVQPQIRQIRPPIRTSMQLNYNVVPAEVPCYDDYQATGGNAFQHRSALIEVPTDENLSKKESQKRTKEASPTKLPDVATTSGHLYSSPTRGISQTTIELSSLKPENNQIPILFEKFKDFGKVLLVEICRLGEEDKALVTFSNACEAAKAIRSIRDGSIFEGLEVKWFQDCCLLGHAVKKYANYYKNDGESNYKYYQRNKYFSQSYIENETATEETYAPETEDSSTDVATDGTPKTVASVAEYTAKSGASNLPKDIPKAIDLLAGYTPKGAKRFPSKAGSPFPDDASTSSSNVAEYTPKMSDNTPRKFTTVAEYQPRAFAPVAEYRPRWINPSYESTSAGNQSASTDQAEASTSDELVATDREILKRYKLIQELTGIMCEEKEALLAKQIEEQKVIFQEFSATSRDAPEYRARKDKLLAFMKTVMATKDSLQFALNKMEYNAKVIEKFERNIAKEMARQNAANLASAQEDPEVPPEEPEVEEVADSIATAPPPTPAGPAMAVPQAVVAPQAVAAPQAPQPVAAPQAMVVPQPVAQPIAQPLAQPSPQLLAQPSAGSAGVAENVVSRFVYDDDLDDDDEDDNVHVINEAFAPQAASFLENAVSESTQRNDQPAGANGFNFHNYGNGEGFVPRDDEGFPGFDFPAPDSSDDPVVDDPYLPFGQIVYTKIIVTGYEEGTELAIVEFFKTWGTVIDKEILDEEDIPTMIIVYDNVESAENAFAHGKEFRGRKLNLSVIYANPPGAEDEEMQDPDTSFNDSMPLQNFNEEDEMEEGNEDNDVDEIPNVAPEEEEEEEFELVYEDQDD